MNTVEWVGNLIVPVKVSVRNSFNFHAQMFIVALFCLLHLSLEFHLAEFHILCVDKGHSARFIEEEALKT